MKKILLKLRDIVIMLVIIVITFIFSNFIQKEFQANSIVPMFFNLAVFLVAIFTDGYLVSIIASLISMLAVNFAFTFPYFEFNFSIPVNLLSGICMMTVTLVTSTLMTKIKIQEKNKVEIEKEKMRANLLRAISHDLRTPLTSIHGASTAIIDNYSSLTKEQHLRLLGEVREDSEWLIRMVENLLSITKIDDDGNVKISKSPIVLEELVDGVLTKFYKIYPNQHIEVNIPDDFIRVKMDPMLIEQVIMNILENAVEHAKGMTLIKFKIYMQANNVVFEIGDNGCGISEDDLENLFSGNLGKKDIPADNKKSSMRIGLSVCATIIKAHKGSIMAENKKDGGALFRFTLPKEEDIDEQ